MPPSNSGSSTGIAVGGSGISSTVGVTIAMLPFPIPVKEPVLVALPFGLRLTFGSNSGLLQLNRMQK